MFFWCRMLQGMRVRAKFSRSNPELAVTSVTHVYQWPVFSACPVVLITRREAAQVSLPRRTMQLKLTFPDVYRGASKEKSKTILSNYI